MKTRLVPVLMVLWLASCAPQAQQPVQTAAPPPPATVPASPPPSTASSEEQIAPGLWEVERVRWSDPLGADDDRAAAAMFYYGYLAAKAGIHVIDVGKIDQNVDKVMKQCAATPNITVPQAFREALRPRPRRSAG